MAMLLAGTVLITLSSQVKLPSLLALGFVAMALACRWGGTFKAFLVAGGSLTRGVAGGDGGDRLGQRPGLRLALHPRHRQRGAQLDVAADAARRWAPVRSGILLGLGDHTTAVLA